MRMIDMHLKLTRTKVMWAVWALATIPLLYMIAYKINTPYANVWAFASFWSCVILFQISWLPHAKAKEYAAVWIVAFLIGCISWSIISYEAYYSGLRRATSDQAKSFYKSVTNVVTMTDDAQDQKSRIESLIEETRAARLALKVTKNGDPIFQRDFADYMKTDYQQETLLDTTAEHAYIKSEPIYANGARYDVQFLFANQPYLPIGLARAVSFSVIHDDYSYKNYILSSNYQRSTDFVITFLLSFLGMIGYMNVKRKGDVILQQNEDLEANAKQIEQQKDELEAQNDELASQRDEMEAQRDEIEAQAAELSASNDQLIDTNRKLSIFKSTYHMIQRDVNAAGHQSAQNLQHIQSGWDMKEKTAARSKRHDIINRLRALKSARIEDLTTADEIENYTERLSLFKQLVQMFAEEHGEENFSADMYDLILEPWINRIHKELGGLDQILNIEAKDTAVSELLASIDAAHHAIPANMEKGISTTPLEKVIDDDIDGTRQGFIILDKVDSMIFNLIGNSAAAIQEYKKRLRHESPEQARAYRPLVKLHVYQQGDFLGIEVRDNGGGFPDDIIHKIYHDPIPSTKKTPVKRQYGEGTSYIGFFAELMDIQVTASNVRDEDGHLGACTKLMIPIKKMDATS